MTIRKNPFNGARVFRDTKDTIFIPIPGDLCVQEERNIGCSCGFCDGDGLWDTIAIRAKPAPGSEPFEHAWTVHHPELRDIDFAERRAAVATGVDRWAVIVGNIGTVHTGADGREAHRVFDSYRDASQDGTGRGAGESVTLFQDDEPIREFEPQEPTDDN